MANYRSGKLQSTVDPAERFARIENPKIQRSTFDRSHGYKTTLDEGTIYPVFIDEALPGDTMNLRATMFGRLSTALKPIMDNIKFDIHFFSVPYRLVYENWEKLNGQQDNPNDSIDYLVPTITSPAGGYGEQSIYDYFGIPTKVAGLEHSSLPLRAYNLIWNEWYRDQNLQNSLPVPRGDGPDNPSFFTLQKRNKRKDYFTSALPWAQKGDPVMLPLGDIAPVYGPEDGDGNVRYEGFKPGDSWKSFDLRTASDGSVRAGSSSFADQVLDIKLGSKSYFENLPSGSTFVPHYADLSDATAATINAIREAFQVQRLLERDARGGTRYTEILKAHFGVTSPDARLQRPEFLGGGSVDVNMTPVAQTSSTDETTPQGNLSAIGTFSVNQNGFIKSFTEHELVLGLVSIRADLNYQQGLNRMWSRSTRYDFYWPAFAHLGEQAILNKEIYAQGTEADDDVFGYQERYAEYRYKPSLITGLYRSNAAQSLDLWHLAQDFDSLPALNSSFIEENPPIERVVATPDEPHFLLDCFFKLHHTRPMPTYATPGMMDHF